MLQFVRYLPMKVMDSEMDMPSLNQKMQVMILEMLLEIIFLHLHLLSLGVLP